MEGVITTAVAIAAAIFLVGFPDNKKLYRGFLTERERQYVLAIINQDRNDAEVKEPFSIKPYLRNGLDLKVWGFGFLFCMLLVVAYSFSYFLPIILQRGMGFSMAAAQCLVTPPYVGAGLMMYFQGWLGDKYKMRAPLLVANCLVTLVGLPVMAFTTNNAGRYVYVVPDAIGSSWALTCSGAHSSLCWG